MRFASSSFLSFEEVLSHKQLRSHGFSEPERLCFLIQFIEVPASGIVNRQPWVVPKTRCSQREPILAEDLVHHCALQIQLTDLNLIGLLCGAAHNLGTHDCPKCPQLIRDLLDQGVRRSTAPFGLWLVSWGGVSRTSGSRRGTTRSPPTSASSTPVVVSPTGGPQDRQLVAVGWRLLSRSSIHFDPSSFKIFRFLHVSEWFSGARPVSAALREAVLLQLDMSSDVRPPGDTFCLPLSRQEWWQLIFRYDQLSGDHGGHFAWLVLDIPKTQNARGNLGWISGAPGPSPPRQSLDCNAPPFGVPTRTMIDLSTRPR